MFGNHQQDCNFSFTIEDSDYLKDDACVFKLIDPVLAKQDNLKPEQILLLTGTILVPKIEY